jgi:hypothetical protein
MERLQAGARADEDPFRELPASGAGSEGVDSGEPPLAGAVEGLQGVKRGPGRPPTYPTLFDRLMAHVEVNEFTGCWEWTGYKDRWEYPKITMRVDGKPQGMYAHRLMLELAHGYYFPHDEAGHLCDNPRCIYPGHLEIQTTAFNLSERKAYMHKNFKACMIPTLYPIEDWKPNPIIEAIVRPSDECPF